MSPLLVLVLAVISGSVTGFRSQTSFDVFPTEIPSFLGTTVGLFDFFGPAVSHRGDMPPLVTRPHNGIHKDAPAQFETILISGSDAASALAKEKPLHDMHSQTVRATTESPVVNATDGNVTIVADVTTPAAPVTDVANDSASDSIKFNSTTEIQDLSSYNSTSDNATIQVSVNETSDVELAVNLEPVATTASNGSYATNATVSDVAHPTTTSGLFNAVMNTALTTGGFNAAVAGSTAMPVMNTMMTTGGMGTTGGFNAAVTGSPTTPVGMAAISETTTRAHVDLNMLTLETSTDFPVVTDASSLTNNTATTENVTDPGANAVGFDSFTVLPMMNDSFAYSHSVTSDVMSGSTSPPMASDVTDMVGLQPGMDKVADFLSRQYPENGAASEQSKLSSGDKTTTSGNQTQSTKKPVAMTTNTLPLETRSTGAPAVMSTGNSNAMTTESPTVFSTPQQYQFPPERLPTTEGGWVVLNTSANLGDTTISLKVDAVRQLPTTTQAPKVMTPAPPRTTPTPETTTSFWDLVLERMTTPFPGNKPGTCPGSRRVQRTCAGSCRRDSDCIYRRKCCHDGNGQGCCTYPNFGFFENFLIYLYDTPYEQTTVPS